MFSDHDNPSNAVAAAPAHEESSTSGPTEQNTTQENAVEQAAVAAATPAHTEDSGLKPATTPAETKAEAAAAPETAHAEAEAHSAAHAATAEATAADEEAAGSEEMSKLLEQYDEKQEAAASNEVIEVKVVAYTEHGVVVDLGGKTEGLVPAAEFTDTEIPRPEPNSKIEVQRTGEHKDGYAIVSYQKVLRRKTWEKIDASYKAKETITGKVVDRIKGGLVVDILGVRAFLPGSQYDLRPTANLDD